MLDSSQETNHIICKSIHLVEVENISQVEVEVNHFLKLYHLYLKFIAALHNLKFEAEKLLTCSDSFGP